MRFQKNKEFYSSKSDVFCTFAEKQSNIWYEYHWKESRNQGTGADIRIAENGLKLRFVEHG